MNALGKHSKINKLTIKLEYLQASVRAFLAHPLRIVKRQFGFIKARYKVLAEDHKKLAVIFALANTSRLSRLMER
jgi:IS5 family transposase